MANIPPTDQWERLRQRLTEQRQQRLIQAAAKRTNHLRLVLQDIHHPHNVSACLRSAEAFGILNVDIVTLNEPFKVSTVAKGVSDWLNIQVFKEIADCIKVLKESGYKLAAAFPDQTLLPLHEISVTDKIAVVLGNEHEGLHGNWLPYLDLKFTIPMFGLVESFNISVACAITLYDLHQRALQQLGKQSFYLNTTEQRQLLNKWVGNT